MTTTFVLDIVNDLPGGKVNIVNLDKEIRASSITIALDRIDIGSDGNTNRIDIIFKADLSADEEVMLSSLLANHDSAIKPNNQEVVVVNEISTKKSSLASNVYIFSPDLTDKTTWYHDGIKVTDQILGVGDGIQTEFHLPHGGNGQFIVDLTHGKVTDEDNIQTPDGQYDQYPVKLSIDGNILTEREVYQNAGGDWEMDYETGIITLFAPLSEGATLKADSYWYVPENAKGFLFKVTAQPGTETNIDYVEAQFSVDFGLKDSVVYSFTPVAFPNILLIRPLTYKNMWNVVDYNVGTYPVIEKTPGLMSGANISNTRDLSEDIRILPWTYLSELKVDGDLVTIPGLGPQKIQLVSFLKHGNVCQGTRATISIYGTNRPKN